MGKQKEGQGISWTQYTWNFIRGCSRVSQGCMNCYAEEIAARFSGPGQAFDGLAYRTASGEARWTGKVNFYPKKLAEPLRWQEPKVVFVNAVSDMFHETLDNELIAAAFAVMAATPKNTYQVLTKRPSEMLDWFKWLSDDASEDRSRIRDVLASYGANELGDGSDSSQQEWFDKLCTLYDRHGFSWPLKNVHIGVTVENQDAADKRIPLLMMAPGTVRFLSCEPLLGAVDVSRWLGTCRCMVEAEEGAGTHAHNCPATQPRLDWIIAGGESGLHHRPAEIAWFESLAGQCKQAGVCFWMKQLGGHPDKKGRLEDLPEHLRIRQAPGE